MEKIKKFIRRMKRAWSLANRIRIIKNGATNTEEIWIEVSRKANKGICSSYYRIA